MPSRRALNLIRSAGASELGARIWPEGGKGAGRETRASGVTTDRDTAAQGRLCGRTGKRKDIDLSGIGRLSSKPIRSTSEYRWYELRPVVRNSSDHTRNSRRIPAPALVSDRRRKT